jgi:phosphate transport system substrate-binding protein
MTPLSLRRVVALAATTGVLAAVPAVAAAKPIITMSGSTSVAPLAGKLAKAYVKSCGHCVQFSLLQGGSDVGIADISHGRVTIGNSSRDPKPTDPGGITFNPIAKDAICLITNKSNALGNLSQSTVQSIYSGRVRQWSQVPGAKVSGPIQLVDRTAASGTQDAFQKIFMNPLAISSSAAAKGSNGLVQLAVQKQKRAIGFVSLAFTAGTHPVSYKGVRCTLRNAKSGQYGGVRTFYMVTRGKAKGAAKKWIHWIKTNATAKRITASEWVPLA